MARDLRTQKRRPDPAASDVLLAGRYELDELIGRGSMASVYRGRDVVLDRPVAIKLFRQDAPDAADAARFEQEARLLARLSHSGLVTVFDAGIDAAVTGEKQPYLVMEYVQGEALSDRLRRGPLPPNEVAVLAAQIASALAYVHRRGIVHRDVKPANIILPPPSDAADGGVAKLADFGIARLVDGTRVTLTGFTIGTANYLSPEQLNGGPIGPPSDIYSLALVLLECLTGEVAFPGHGAEAAMPRLQHPPAIPASVPEGWARLLRTMTDMRPEARPGAPEVGVAAVGFGDDAPAPDASTQTRVLPVITEPVVARSRSRWWPWALAGLAALLVAIVLGVTTGGSPAHPPTQPAYPAVAGALGSDLTRLQHDVAFVGPVGLRTDVLDVTQSAYAHDWTGARSALTKLGSDTTAALSAGQLSATQASAIRSDSSLVAADLARSAHPATKPTPRPKPPPAPKHHDHGHGGGGGGGDGGGGD